MNPKLSIARGLVKIKDLMPGTLFIHDGSFALKISQRHYGILACECYAIGTGEPLYDFTISPEDFNDIMVTPIRIDFSNEEETK